MWLVLLSLVALENVQSAIIGYPYRSVWAYNPFKTGTLHGYLRYLDNTPAAGLVGISNHQQPVYAVRQIKYFNSAAPALETFGSKNSEEIIKARETYLRAASLQQYQNLKSSVDALRAEGKEPSAEKLSKLRMLEKIAFTSDFSMIGELPELKSTLQDLEASISGLQSESVQQTSTQQANVDQSQGEIKTYVGNPNIPLVTVDETPEQRQAHEDHLRIYNEQIAHLKQLELEHQKYVEQASLKSKNPQIPNENKLSKEQLETSKDLAELVRAQQEHLRLSNEAKLRAEQTGYESGEKGLHEKANKQQISAITSDQKINSFKQTIPSSQNSELQQFEDKNVKTASSSLEHSQQLSDKSVLLPQVVDTPEVVRAREEHLRIVNEAISRAQAETQQQSAETISQKENAKSPLESLGPQVPTTQAQNLKDSSFALSYRSEQSFVEETPEVKKAREEHLRLVQEANERAQFVEQQELKYKHEAQTPILKSQYEHPHNAINQPEDSQNVFKPRDEHLRLINDAQAEKGIVFPLTTQEQQQLSSESQVIGETAEVQRARAEHLRIFNAIKSHHAEQEKVKQNSRSFPHMSSEQNPILDLAFGEEKLLELERFREAERLQKEQQQLEMDRLREAERLAEEKRQLEAELMRLRLEDEQRLEMERQLEEKRLQQEQEDLQKLRNGEYQEIVIQNDSIDQQQPQISIVSNSDFGQARSQQNTEAIEQQSQQYVGNPFLKIGKISSEPVNLSEYSVSQQSSLLKTTPVQVPTNTHQQNAVASNSAVNLSDSNARYIPSSQHSSGSTHQYIKDDNIKYNYHNTVSSQPADTAVALIALEKATNDHFRAHELALEQLRLARLQNQAIKDCN